MPRNTPRSLAVAGAGVAAAAVAVAVADARSTGLHPIAGPTMAAQASLGLAEHAVLRAYAAPWKAAMDHFPEAHAIRGDHLVRGACVFWGGGTAHVGGVINAYSDCTANGDATMGDADRVRKTAMYSSFCGKIHVREREFVDACGGRPSLPRGGYEPNCCGLAAPTAFTQCPLTSVGTVIGTVPEQPPAPGSEAPESERPPSHPVSPRRTVCRARAVLMGSPWSRARPSSPALASGVCRDLSRASWSVRVRRVVAAGEELRGRERHGGVAHLAAKS